MVQNGKSRNIDQNPNCGVKFCSKIETLLENQNFGQNLKF